MCGICGILGPAGRDPVVTVTAMANAIRHRGPDAGDAWADAGAGIALGHRRLSILDLSPAGAQPMASTSGRYVVAFNGEIYNHLALRDDLAARGRAPGWRGHSDTETLLALIDADGLPAALRAAQGMFALALWDREARVLHLSRDRMGEKPLYLARTGVGWAFGSELKALHAFPGFRPLLSHEALRNYIAYGYVPEEFCIFEGVQKVPPGTIVTLTGPGADPRTEPYQSFDRIAAEAIAHRDPDGQARFEETLSRVVAEQMISDVPLGCFLSGGIDSSLIAALMQAHSDRPVRTFSIGFTEARFNEAPHAAAVAAHLKTDHTEFILSEDDALAIVPALPAIYDEPFADSSQIPTALLCREARGGVTVALTGDGGDEVFGGYNRHILGPGLMRRVGRVPRALRAPMGRAAAALGPLVTAEDAVLRRVSRRLGLPVTALDKAVSLGPVLASADCVADLYRHFTRAPDWSRLVTDPGIPDPPGLSDSLAALGPAEWMMAMDSRGYLPGDILVKVDRAAMAVSLETRAPFLDARVIAAAWALPPEAKIVDGKGKQPLRRLLYRHVPQELMERPKQGFSIPLDRWLRGGLRDWAQGLLDDDSLFATLPVDAAAARALWQTHQSGRRNNGQLLWTLLMLLAWVAQYRDTFDHGSASAA